MPPVPPHDGPAAPQPRSSTVLIAGGGTGGHLMPALAIASELRHRRPDLEVVLVGAERGIEATLLPARDFRYHLLAIEPLYRRQWWKNLRWPWVFFAVHRQLGEIFQAEQPVAVLGTGGYASAPAVWYAARHGIPTAIQEQNAFPGLASRLLSRSVRQVYLGLPEARTQLRLGRGAQMFDTGNPIVPPDPARRPSAARRLGIIEEGKPVVLITGGSQGALAINEAVAGWIDAGKNRDCTLLWTTGRGTHARFVKYHRPPQVQVFDFFDPMADAYSVASLVVSRAGMMTGAELCAWGLPAVLVPLPSAAADHQTWNAEALAGAGAARVLAQRDLSPASFETTVGGLLRDPVGLARMADSARKRGKPNAAAEIVSHLLTLF